MRQWLKTEAVNRCRRDRVNHAPPVNKDFDHVGANLHKGREYRSSDGVLGAQRCLDSSCGIRQGRTEGGGEGFDMLFGSQWPDFLDDAPDLLQCSFKSVSEMRVRFINLREGFVVAGRHSVIVVVDLD